MAKLFANSEDPDPTPHSAGSPDYSGLNNIARDVKHQIIIMIL